MPFRVRTKKVYLTYPQVGQPNEVPDLDQWVDALKTIGDDDPKSVLVSRERHEDGNWHIHALCVYEDTQDIRDERMYDLFGHHPNVQNGKHANKIVKYIKKDGEYKHWGLPVGAARKKQRLMIAIACGELTYQEALMENEGLAHGIKNNQADINIMRNMFKPATDRTVIVYWLYGPTGTGKSRWAYQQYPDAYRMPVTGKFFGNYTGQEVLIFDDFNPAYHQHKEMLQYLDRYPIEVEIKGGHMYARWTTVIITSHLSPEACFPNSWPTGELRRRINHLINFGSDLERQWFLQGQYQDQAWNCAQLLQGVHDDVPEGNQDFQWQMPQ